ncbi:hypothetical protein K4F52_001965 [Lecanicillium sp. MT-2017a]|nr:hypothetical protein K4F52_001965 [Lecanicillium sp. MT-2017a]
MNAARDYDSIRLAVSLLQQDLAELKAQSKGKQKAGEINDSDIAIQATKDNLDAIIQEIEDFQLLQRHLAELLQQHLAELLQQHLAELLQQHLAELLQQHLAELLQQHLASQLVQLALLASKLCFL